MIKNLDDALIALKRSEERSDLRAYECRRLLEQIHALEEQVKTYKAFSQKYADLLNVELPEI